MRLRDLIEPAALITAATLAIEGFPGEEVILDITSDWEVLLFSRDLVKHPLLLLPVLGFALLYTANLVVELGTRHKAHQRFHKTADEMSPVRSDFFAYLDRLYHQWASAPEVAIEEGPLPAGVNQFIDELDYPNWIPTRRPMLNELARHTNEIEMPWRFFFELYEQVEGVRRGRLEPGVLSRDENEQFHRSRQRLAAFYAETGEGVRQHRLRYNRIRDRLLAHERLLKVLPYLDIALMKENKQRGRGRIDLFWLGKCHFEKKLAGPGFSVERWIRAFGARLRRWQRKAR